MADQATIVDVARRARVSLGTVSRVINRHPSVTPALRERVLVASRQLGFAPRVQHHAIGVIVGFNPATLFSASTALVALLMQQLAARDYTMELVDLEDIDLAYEAHVEGIIGVIFDERITKLHRIPNQPVVTINQPMLEQGIHSVCTDHFQQAVLATDHLLQHGHRAIAFLENGPTNWGSQQRLAGYRVSLEKAGVEFDPQLICYAKGDPVYAQLNRLVRRGITGIVNFSEDYGLEVLHVLTHILKLSIPQDISVVTMENQPVFEYLSPPQTVIRQPLEELAKAAVEQVLRLRRTGCERGGTPINIVLPCELIERESVAQVGDRVAATKVNWVKKEGERR